MFYADSMSNALRFGDVVQGFPSYAPVISKPPLSPAGCNYRLDVDVPRFSVILSPCCSIGDSMMSLCPLKPVQNSFFKNSYFSEELTRLNRIMNPQHFLPTEEWDKLSKEEKQQKRPDYAFYWAFIYAPHSLLSTYDVIIRGATLCVEHYMVDFRDVVKVKCSDVKSAEKAPINIKKLELTVETRRDLREKMASYYHRPASEDRRVLDTLR